jgi:hypothetical protein
MDSRTGRTNRETLLQTLSGCRVRYSVSLYCGDPGLVGEAATAASKCARGAWRLVVGIDEAIAAVRVVDEALEPLRHAAGSHVSSRSARLRSVGKVGWGSRVN